MDDRDVADIKQKLVDIETALQSNHNRLFEAIGVVDNQVGKLTEGLTALVKQVQDRGEGTQR